MRVPAGRHASQQSVAVLFRSSSRRPLRFPACASYRGPVPARERYADVDELRGLFGRWVVHGYHHGHDHGDADRRHLHRLVDWDQLPACRGTTFTADVEGTITATDTATGDTLTLSIDGELSGDGSGAANAPFTFTGVYTITGGTGQFAGATGAGRVEATGTDSGQTGTLTSLTLDGAITTIR